MTEASFRGRDGALIIDAPREPVRLSADRSKLMQILLNLVKNAQEAWDARDGGRDDADDDRSALARPALARPALAVRVEAGVTADGGLRITVRDNGCGFAPEHTASLFALGESSKARGTGTGLHAARNIAIGLGGSLELSSPGPGAGATASLTLPSEVIYRESSP
jgi:C4-dicarboxylate-specific signal transduction histidine kinase